jgi:hypothetical protein
MSFDGFVFMFVSWCLPMQPAKPLNKAAYPSNTLAALAMSDEIDSRDVQGLSVGQLRDRISKLQQDTTEVL